MNRVPQLQNNLLARFEEQVAKQQGAVALIMGDATYTYAQVNARANQIAGALRALGIGASSFGASSVDGVAGTERPVALCMPRSPEAICAILGILKAGGAYVPIDPAYPTARQIFLLQDAGVQILLTDSAARAAPLADLVDQRFTFEDDGWFRHQSTENTLTPVAADALFHILYTSGSTGNPKGVCGTHGQMWNRLAWLWQAFPLTEEEICCHKTTLHFVDASLEIFGALLQGRPLVILPESSATNPDQFLAMVAAHGVTRLFLVVSHLRALLMAVPNLGELLPKLKGCVVSGERLTRQLVEEFHQAAPNALLTNLYGCTEVPEISWVALPAAFPFTGESAPIGYPIPGSEIYIVDETLQPVAPGEVGELLVGSPLQSRGYLNRPDDTAARFVANPFGQSAQLYRTGDRVHAATDGLLHYVGRADHQVKIRGYRVELPEVESALQADAQVAMGVVVVQEDPELAENRQLFAFVTPQTVDTEALSARLQTRLPVYMVPHRIVALAELPLTPSGKVDRQKLTATLPPKNRATGAAQQAVASTKVLLTAIWCRLLQREQVGLHDNFFDVGGNSLALAQLHQTLREQVGDRAPTITMLLQYPTIDALARYMDQVENQPGNQADTVPLTSHAPRSRRTGEGQEIAIIGMACRFPGAATPDAFWQNLRMGVESIAPFSDAELEERDPALRADPDYVKMGAILADIAGFDADFFGYSAREAELLDPQQRLLLECAWEALEQAGYAPDGYPERVGVYAGSSMSNYFLNNVASKRPFTEASLQEFQANLANDRNFLSTRISYKLNLQGPSVNVQTACSTGLVAVHLACQSLQLGECELALAGSVALRVPQKSGYLYEEGMIRSRDGRCRAFDAQAQGTLFGNGAGMVVLKPLAAAQAAGDTILAVIKGSAINNDGAGKVGFTAPSIQSQANVVAAALDAADVDVRSISYIEAHGTGTPLGDPVEIAALTQAFARQSNGAELPHQFCAIGSVKTNIGHLDEAAGIAGLMKSVLALHHKELPPTLHFTAPNPEIDFARSPFYVNATLTSWPEATQLPRRAGVSSFGMGGTNCHLILEEAPQAATESEPLPAWAMPSHHLLTLSAPNEAALCAMAERYAHFLEEQSTVKTEINLADLCYTANTGRKHFPRRCALAADSLPQLRGQLTALSEHSAFHPTPLHTGKIAFLFTGQGAQYGGMGRQLYESQPFFRATIDHCDEILAPYLDQPLLSVLFPQTETDATRESLLSQTVYTQPALFALEYALAQLWQSWGITPDIVMGHSVGEYVAACVAGVFSLEDGLKLIAERGRLMQALPQDGGMVAVAADEQQISAIIASYRDTVSIAAINGPENLVISGHRAALQALGELLAEQGIKQRRLTVSHAFHSPLMAPMLDAFREAAARVTYAEPKIELVSNVTGAFVSAAVTDPAYWVQHVSAPVRFADGLQLLQQKGVEVLIEMGPKPTLLGMAGAIYESIDPSIDPSIDLSGEPPLMLPTLRDGKAEWAQTLESLGRLYTRGIAIDWGEFYRGQQRRKVSLPTYPFQRQRHWIEPDHTAPVVQPQSDNPLAQLAQTDLSDLATRLVERNGLTAEEVRILPKLLDLLAKEGRDAAARAAIQDAFYAVRWQPKALLTPAPSPEVASRAQGSWLICADQSGVGEALAASLADAGHTPILLYRSQTLQQASGHRWSINPNDSEQLIQLQQAIVADESLQPLHGIVHLWSLDTEIAEEWTAAGLMAAQEVGCGSVLALLDLLTHSDQQTRRLWLVTQGAQAIHANDAAPNIAQSTLWGMGRTIALDFPQQWGGLIDLMPGQSPSASAQALRNELWAATGDAPRNAPREEQIAYRQDGRYVARLQRSNLATAASPAAIHKDATYLITGGLGGLGLAIARHLAARGARHLVLTSRRGVTTEAQATKVAQLEAMGVHLDLAQVDVSDAQAMAALFARLRANDSYPPLRGIVHAAGVIQQEPADVPSWARATGVLAPKVAGSWHLHQLSQGMALDFFLLCSSASSWLGLMGNSDYAAANAFLDALAHYRRQQDLPALSISWGDWADVGMAAAVAKAQTPSLQPASPAATTLAKPLQIAEGLAAFEQLLDQQGHIGVMQIDWRRFADLMQAHQLFLADLLHTRGTEEGAIVTQSPQPRQVDLRTELAQASTAERPRLLAEQLVTLVTRVLGQPDRSAIDPQQNLLAFGFDSLMLVELRNHMRKVWGIQIELPRLLQGIAVHEMAEALLAQLDLTDCATDCASGQHDSEYNKQSHDTNGADHENVRENEGEEEWVTVTF